MSVMPDGWRLVLLCEVADTQLGKMLSPKAKVGARPKAYLRNRDVQWGAFAVDDLPTMDFTEEESAKFALQQGDVVVCEGGEVGRAAIWRRGATDVHFQKALHRVRCSPALMPEYLFYLLRHYGYSRTFDSLVTGSTINHLPQEDLRRLPIPLPPPSEQRQIVEVIEEQFSRLDAAEASLTHVEHRANALAEAAYRAVRSSRWPSVKLSTIAKTSSGGTPSRRKVENFCGTIPWVKSGELGDSHVRATAERISDTGLASSSAKLLRRGTLMMAMYGATVGKLGILDLDSAATNQAVCAIEPHEAELVPFLWLCLRAMRCDLIDSAKGGAQPNISQGMIRDLMIPMPPPEERSRLISQTALQVSACERVATAAVKGRLQIRRLRRAILDMAFSGRLVSQSHGEGVVSAASVTPGADRATRALAKRNGAPSRPKSEVVAW